MKIFLPLFFLFLHITILPQNESWKLFGYDNFILDITVDGDVAWAATATGAAELNLINGELNFYSKANHIELSNIIPSVAVDQNGNKWFGGVGKLTKYDGVTFSVYNSYNSPIGPYGWIDAICSDKAGNLWAGGNGMPLYKFDGTNWTLFNTTNSGLPNNHVNSIAVDSNNVKWIGTFGGGIAEFNDTSWIIHIPNSVYINEVTVDNNGNIWAALYGDGLAKYNGSSWTVYNTGNSPLPHDYLKDVYSDAQGNIWAVLGIYSEEYSGIVRFDGTNWYFFDSTNSNISSSITALGIDIHGNVIAGSLDGIYQQKENDFELFQISNTPPLMSYIHSLELNNSTGELWVGSQHALLKYDGKNWAQWDTSNSPLPDVWIRDLFLDRQTRLWIATDGGVTVLDGEDWTNYNTSNSGLPDNKVRHITEDAEGKKWISTEAGIAVFDEHIWEVYNTSNSPLPSNAISQTVIQGDIKWFAVYGGLVKLDDNWTIFDTSNSALMTLDVIRVAVQSDSIVWAGTRNAGLTCFSGDTSFTYTTQNSGLADDHIECLVADKDTLWIGLQNGFNKLYKNNWQHFNTFNSPISGGSTKDIIVDDSGNRWIGNWSSGWGADLAYYSINSVTDLDPTNISIPVDKSLLSQNYPNPFNPKTSINYAIQKQSVVVLKIFDILGNEIAVLVNEEKPAGEYKVNWDASNYSSGVYFYQLKAGGFTSTKKLLLMK